MLVLSRKLGERIIIGDDIAVTVVKVEGGRVRIGIDAPGHVKVYREELVPEADQVKAAGPVHRSGKHRTNRLLSVAGNRDIDG